MDEVEPNRAADRWKAFVERPLEPDPTDFIARLRASLSAGFVRADRRRVTALPDAALDEFVEQALVTHYDVGARPRTFVDRVVAVRGDRLALVDSRLVYADAGEIAYLAVIRFDERIEFVDRMVMFETDDVVAAVAELDRQDVALAET